MQDEPGIPRRCSIFPGRAPHPPRPSRRWGAGAALVVLAAVLGIATPEDAQAQAPSAPRQFRISVNDEGRATLTWAVPTNGGTTITKYQYRYSAGNMVGASAMWTDVPDGADADTDAGNETTVTVTGLTGTEYTFEVRAVNSVGEGPAATKTVRAPSAPQQFSVRIAADNGEQATLTWDAPQYVGTTNITRYQYRYSAGNTVDTSATWTDVPDGADDGAHASDERTVTVTGLTTGTVYAFELRAVSGAGPGPVVRQTVTAPDEPQQFSVMIAAAQATLTWDAPTNDGGATITKYQYRYSPGDTVDTSVAWSDVPDGADTDPDAGNETTVTVTGLTGTVYAFEVRAVNSVGAGSAATQTVTVPSEPRQFSVRIAADDGTQATLTWAVPTNAGGAPITKYQYRYSAGSMIDTSADWTDVPDGADPDTDAGNETTVTVTGLTTRPPHTFQVRAVNSVGPGDEATKTVTVPSMPLQFSVRITADDGGQATLTWDAPMFVGTTNITRYQYRYSVGDPDDTSAMWSDWTDVPDGADVGNHASDERTVTVTGLTTGTDTFQVRAVNDGGGGPAAKQTVTAPDEPQQFSVMIAAAQATLTWAVPTNDGGATITKYQYRYSAGNTVDTSVAWSDVPDGADADTDAGNETTVTVTGLTGTVHTFQVRAVNSVGEGRVAMQTVTVTVPSAPRQFSVMIAAAQATLTWAVPTNDGGTTITKYEYRYSAGSTVDTSAAWSDVPDGADADTDAGNETTVTVTGLTGTVHTFEVRAVNSVGAGSAATQTVTVPSEPRRFTISSVNDEGRAILRWSVPTSDGGAPITHYEYRYAVGTTVPASTMWTSQTQTPPDDTDAIAMMVPIPSKLRTAVVTGLTTNTQYTFEVRARNSVGAGDPADPVTATVPRALIELSWDQREAWLGPSFTLTITFSEAVTGFELNDLSITTYSMAGGNGIQSSGDIEDFRTISAGTTYSVEVTPTPPGSQRALSVVVIIRADAVQTSNGPNRQKEQVIDLILPVTGTEREALTALYNATDGANWTSKDNWLDDDMDLDDWHGVTTNTAGKVTELDLENNELSGSLPVELGNLRNLTHLYLHRNALSGPIPPDLGLFENLEHLHLHRNALSGAIPERLGRLNLLEQLYLQGNKLSGPIPPEFRPNSLVDLKLHSNTDLSEPLPAISPTALPNLKELGMQNTALTIPENTDLTTAQTQAFAAWSARITSGTQTSDGVITLDAANTRPSGLWADDTTLYVVGEDGGKVYAYTLADGVRDSAKDITLDTANTHPTGLWSDGTTLWVLDYEDRKIYAYTLAGGGRDTAKDIDPVPAGYGLWGRKDAACTGSDATCLLWVARAGQLPIRLMAYRIYADTSASVTYGSANAGFDKALPTGDLIDIESDVSGFWWEDPDPEPDGDPPTVWISDRFDAALYAYSANPRMAGESSSDIVSAAMQNRILAPDNLSPTAFWSDGTMWWVADLYAGKVFVYGLSAPPPVIMQDPLGMPQSFSAMPGDTQEVVLSWTAPASDGGEAITKYQYRYSAGSTVDTSATTATWTDVPDGADADTDTSNETTFTVTGLTNGMQYAFQVRAVNSGDGPAATDTATPQSPIIPSSDATLSALGLSSNGSDIALTPTFASGTTSYTASVLNGVDEITITPTVNESNATVQYQDSSDMDITDADDAKSGHQVSLDVGENTIKVKVTAEDRTTPETYTVTVTRLLPSADATLSALGLSSNGSDITLTPTFASGTTSYTASVPNGVDEITITPTVNESNATVEYQDSSDMDITDADATKDGQQVSLSVGATNTIKVKVTAEDRTTTETYTVVVTRAEPDSTDATLSKLELSNASNDSPITLTPSFASDIMSYTASSVAYRVAQITIAPTRTDIGASVVYLDGSDTEILDADADAMNGQQVSLAVGPNTIKVKVTAVDSTMLTYTVTVTRLSPSADATLSALGLSSNGSDITLTPTLASGTTSYTASVPNGVDEITITPTVNESNATVQYQDSSDMDITDADDAKSGHQVPLDVGPNTIKVKVTAEDGTTTETYTVTVTRAEPDSTDATLSKLELSNASNDSPIALTPAFASGTTSYTASVPNGVDEITITPTVNESNATVEYQDSSDMDITDADDTPENGHQVPLNVVGENTIKVKVTAEDGTTTETYTVTVTRAEPDSTDATLSALALSNASDDSTITLTPTFASSIRDYTALVANGVDKITITPTVNESNATVEYQDSSDMDITDADAKSGHQVPLDVGENTITVKVTAADDSTTETYTVTVTRAEPDRTDATLRSLALSNASDDSPIALTPTFASSTLDYTASVASSVAQITIAPTTNSSSAGVEYLNSIDVAIDDADADAMNGHQVPLGVGENMIKVKVTSADATTLTYTVTVTRPSPMSDATLSALALSSNGSPITLTPTFASSIRDYTASVPNSVEQITIAPTRTDIGASVVYLDGSDTEILDADADAMNGQQVSLRVGANTIEVQVTAADNTMLTYTVTVTRASATVITPPPIVTTTPTTGGGGGGGGGGPNQVDHGNTPAQATPVTLDPTRTASVPGQINTAADMDYFSAAVPHAGVLVVETSGPTATVGTVWQAGEELATAARGGVGQNFRLSVRVAPGPVVFAVEGNGQQTGRYTLQVTFLPGFLENPGAASFQSGIGLISGWTCDADEVEIVLNGEPQEAAYGTARLDTEAMCGDSDNGFGLLFNWNLLGDGEHEVVALVDGVELDRATVTVTTLGTEFLRDVTGTCTAADFPTGDETVTLAWQQTQQNFVIVDGMPPTGENRTGRAGVGYLENPGPNSFQSGIGVLSGWVCEGAEVIIELNGAPQPAAYGTERLDTLAACGDTANGFGLLFNWNLLGEGEHEVVAFVDSEELGRATVRVTTLGVEFLRGVTGECTVEDFPMLGETVTLEWQQNSQNFVVTDVE